MEQSFKWFLDYFFVKIIEDNDNNNNNNNNNDIHNNHNNFLCIQLIQK